MIPKGETLLYFYQNFVLKVWVQFQFYFNKQFTPQQSFPWHKFTSFKFLVEGIIIHLCPLGMAFQQSALPHWELQIKENYCSVIEYHICFIMPSKIWNY